MAQFDRTWRTWGSRLEFLLGRIPESVVQPHRAQPSVTFRIGDAHLQRPGIGQGCDALHMIYPFGGHNRPIGEGGTQFGTDRWIRIAIHHAFRERGRHREWLELMVESLTLSGQVGGPERDHPISSSCNSRSQKGRVDNPGCGMVNSWVVKLT